jgi:hypothetical protein
MDVAVSREESNAVQQAKRQKVIDSTDVSA